MCIFVHECFTHVFLMELHAIWRISTHETCNAAMPMACTVNFSVHLPPVKYYLLKGSSMPSIVPMGVRCLVYKPLTQELYYYYYYLYIYIYIFYSRTLSHILTLAYAHFHICCDGLFLSQITQLESALRLLVCITRFEQYGALRF